MNLHSPIAERDQTGFLEIVLPEQVDDAGVLGDAKALFLMGKAASVCATRHAGCAAIMAKADNIEFVRRLRSPCSVDVRARVVFQGQSSMTVIVEIVPRTARDHHEAAAITGRFMMVAVDSSGIPMPIRLSESRHAEEAVS